MTEDYYTIQTQDHASTMLSDMFYLQKQGVMCDVILSAEDGEVMAHKVVLMAASKYFREKLSPVVSQRAAKICLKGISVVELANLVKYIYTGKLLVAKETMDITLEISEILELNGVIQGYNEIVSYETMKEKEASQTGQAGQMDCLQDKDEAIKEALSKPISGEDVHLSRATSIALESQNSGLKLPVITQSPSKPSTSKTIEATQTVASEYSFEVNPYEEQYVDVTVGSKTPTKVSNQTHSIPIVTPPRLQQMVDVPADGQNITEEEAQHQDLLAVAIESLTDGSNMISRQNQRPEIERAVSSIIPSPAQETETIQKVNDDVQLEQSEDFINGKTSTKTLTMNAGKVNNEYGGQTEVYTVSLDPATLNAPIIMPRKMKKRTSKEKQAEEAAKTYRKKKTALLQSQYPIIPLGTVFDETEGQQQAPSDTKDSEQQQDFRFASLSKLRKKNQISETYTVVETDLDLECDEIIAGRDSLFLSTETGEFVVEQESIVSSTSDSAEGTNEATKSIKTEIVDHKYLTPLKNVQESPQTPLADDENRSSATKRKARTPKKIALSDAETNSADDKRGKAPAVGTRNSGTNDPVEAKPSSSKKDEEKVVGRDGDGRPKVSKSMFSAKEAVPKVLQPQVRLKRHTESEVDDLVKKVKQDARSLKGKPGKDGQKAIQSVEIQVDIPEGTTQDEEEDPFNEVMKTMNVELHKSGKTTKRQRKSVKRPEFEYDQPVAKKSKVKEYACHYDLCKATFKSVSELLDHCKTCSNKASSRNLFKAMGSIKAVTEISSSSSTTGSAKTKTVGTPTIIKDKNRTDEKQSDKATSPDEKQSDKATSQDEKQSADEPNGRKDEQVAEIGDESAQVAEIGDESAENNLVLKQESGSASPAAATQTSDASSQYAETEPTEKDLFRCNFQNCQTLSDNLGCLKQHYTKFHKKRWDSDDEAMFQQRLMELEENKGAISTDPPWTNIRTEVLYKCVACNMTSTDVQELDTHLTTTHEGVQVKCRKCPEEFSTFSYRIAHENEQHSGCWTDFICDTCGVIFDSYATLLSHTVKKHQINIQDIPNSLRCSYCPDLIINTYADLTNHLSEVHNFVVLANEKVKVASLNKTNYKKVKVVSLNVAAPVGLTKTGKTRKRISIHKLPTEEFTKELLRRHEEFLKKPEKKYKFMSSVLAKNTLMPSFPQASPNIRNTSANKLYNMPKFSHKYTPITEFPGLGQLSGPWVPRVGSEVVVGNQQNSSHGEVVIENVAGEPRVGSTILKLIDRHKDSEEQMIMITTNGIQSVVRSQDFYQTLLESGNESAQTLKVISSLLEAGEEIEIREEGEQVEIQNI